MNVLFGSSWKTTLAGYAVAILIAVIDFVSTGVDLSTPQKATIFWSGLLAAIGVAIKGRFTQDEKDEVKK